MHVTSCLDRQKGFSSGTFVVLATAYSYTHVLIRDESYQAYNTGQCHREEGAYR